MTVCYFEKEIIIFPKLKPFESLIKYIRKTKIGRISRIEKKKIDSYKIVSILEMETEIVGLTSKRCKAKV